MLRASDFQTFVVFSSSPTDGLEMVDYNNYDYNNIIMVCLDQRFISGPNCLKKKRALVL